MSAEAKPDAMAVRARTLLEDLYRIGFMQRVQVELLATRVARIIADGDRDGLLAAECRGILAAADAYEAAAGEEWQRRLYERVVTAALDRLQWDWNEGS